MKYYNSRQKLDNLFNILLCNLAAKSYYMYKKNNYFIFLENIAIY